jgi:hypothetical protein
MEKELIILYFEKLGREPINEEIIYYVDKIKTFELTFDDIRYLIQESEEYKELNKISNYEYEYDPSLNYTMTINNINKRIFYDGVILTNGKIGIKTSSNYNDVLETFITTKYEYNEYKYHTNNILKCFNFCKLDYFTKNGKDNIVTNFSQMLNMYNCIFSNNYNIQYENNSIKVLHELIPLRQYPYCFYQKYIITNLNNDMIVVPMFHKMYSSDNIIHTDYCNNNIDRKMFFSGYGYDKNRKIYVNVKNVYKCEKLEYIGLEYINENECLNNLKLKLNGYESVEIIIITGIMSNLDFDDPQNELNMILLSIYDSNLRVDHINEWNNIWKSDVQIIGKQSNNEIEIDEINEMQYNIRYSLFNLFSRLRDDVNVDINPLNISALDYDGEFYWNAEMFIIPVLLYLKPKYAKILLDYRFLQLENAKKIASAYGYRGSKYLYMNDISDYKDVVWNAKIPLYTVNSGLIAINVWNYFRVSKDKYWLIHKGYKILKNISEFYLDILDDECNLLNTLSINNTIEDNNSLNKYMLICTFKYFIEATYELGYIMNHAIFKKYNMMHINFLPMFNNIQLDKNVTLSTTFNIVFEDNKYMFYDEFFEIKYGYIFGGYSGYTLILEKNEIYTLILDINTYLYFYDYNNTNIYNDVSGNAILTKYGYTNGTFIVKGSLLKTFKNVLFEYIFGINAFSNTDNISSIKHIIKIHDNYHEDEEINIPEPYILLSNYYSKHLFNVISKFNSVDIIRDNLYYYNSVMNQNSKDVMLNKLLQTNLQSILAQNEKTTNLRTYSIQTYYSSTKDIINENQSLPWKNNKHYGLFLFSIINGLGGLTITGSINNQRFYIENYGIKSKTSFVLPKPWKQLKILINNGENFVINNST